MSAPASPTRLTVPVLLDGWQIGCCGTPPALGDAVTWRLHWSPWYADHIHTDMRLPARLRRIPAPEPEIWRSTAPPPAGTVDERVPAIATAGSISVSLDAPAPVPDEVVLTGVLHEDHHAGAAPETPFTSGRITGVWLVSLAYRRRHHSWDPIEGSAEFERVTRAPKHLPFNAPRQDATHWRDTNSVLVDLETLLEPDF